MPRNSTNKQMAVLSFIHKQVDAHGYPPTVREICGAVGLSSTSTVHGHINRLIKKGYLKRTRPSPGPWKSPRLGWKSWESPLSKPKSPSWGWWPLGNQFLRSKTPPISSRFRLRSRITMTCSC